MRDAIDNSRISGSHQSEYSQAHAKAEPTIIESSKLEGSPNDPVLMMESLRLLTLQFLGTRGIQRQRT